jgi:tetratricopeptide (TPR) repeat protein
VLTVRGEPGIGKTRLLEEITRDAERRGMLALVARCHEAAEAPALWPWAQVIGEYLERAGVEARCRPYVAAVAEAMPVLRRRLGPVEKVVHLEPGHARFRVFDGVARVLASGARTAPLLVVLEDVHAADAASLRLLEFVAHECSRAAVLLAASYRDVEIDDASAVAALLSGLRRTARHDEIHLAGLRPADAARLVEQAAPAPVSGAVVESIVRRSDGNPLFLLELLRALGEELRRDAPAGPCGRATLDLDGDVPLGIRALIGRRLAQLAEPCLRTLATAAAIGREFDVTELESVTGSGRGDLAAWLAEAGARRVVAVLPATVGRYRFSHPLVQACLYERIGPGERAGLHSRIAEALETLYAHDLDPHLPEIADHLVRGALAGDAETALAYVLRAARSARARHAYEEAAKHYERGLALWRLGPRRDEAERCALLVDLGEAEEGAGHPDRAGGRFSTALAVARSLRDAGHPAAPELVARAVLGLGSMWGLLGVFDARLVGLLREALAGLAGEGALRVRLLARAAVAHYWSDAVEERERLSAEAVAVARRLGDDASLGHALYARHFAILSPDRSAEQLALAEEIVRIGERCGDAELALTGRHWRIRDRLEAGDLESARRDLREYARLARELCHPHFLWNATFPEATFATLEGRLEEAATLAAHALELGRRGNSQNAEQYFGIQMLMLARLRGAEETAIEPARDFVERVPGIPAWRAALASLYAVVGRTREAGAELARLVPGDGLGVPRDANFLVACAMLSEASAALGHRASARLLYDALHPYASRSVIVAMGAGHLGVVVHYLGLLAAVLGRADRADAWFADALARYEAMRARPFVVRVLLDRARSLLAARAVVCAEAGGDPARAMLERAAAMAREIGMARCATTAERSLRDLEVGARAPIRPRAPVEPERRQCLFRHEGGYWTLVYDGVVVRIRDTKGLAYLQELLRTPGRAVHVLDLLGLAAPPRTGAPPPRGVGRGRGAGRDAGPLLDGRARREYRRRIEDLHHEVAGAEAEADLGRAERARAELAHVTSQLAGALGLDGRDRRAADTAERARLNVTRAIRGVVRRIGLVHGSLARHLEAAVVTGRFCRYEPRDGPRVDWRF